MRRRWNQVFFAKIHVDKAGVIGAELTDELGSLLADDPAQRLEKLPHKPKFSVGDGSIVGHLVELTGLEPATSWVRSTASGESEIAKGEKHEPWSQLTLFRSPLVS